MVVTQADNTDLMHSLAGEVTRQSAILRHGHATVTVTLPLPVFKAVADRAFAETRALFRYAAPKARLDSGDKRRVIGGVAQYLPGGSNQRDTEIDVTHAPYNADNTGATDTHDALAAAIAAVAAGAGNVVKLPAGIYRLDSELDLGTAFNGKTLRGAGPGLTIMSNRNRTGLIVGSQSGVFRPIALIARRVCQTASGGSTSIVASSTRRSGEADPHGFRKNHYP